MNYIERNSNLTPEEQKAKREKMLAIAKASNQLLAESRHKLAVKDESEIDNTKYTDVPAMTKDEKLAAIDEMMDEHLEGAMSYYGATPDEVNSVEYGKPSEEEVRKYNARKARMEAEGKAANATVGKRTEESSKVEENKAEGKTRRKRKTASAAKEAEDLGFKGEIKVEDIKPVNVKAETEVIEKNAVVDSEEYSFDMSDIPDYVQYDVIPLPSNGECYPHKISRVPVAYLTAADENIIFSPNMYRDGKLIDVLLKRKVLDKRVKVEELCSGDRDAIVLWLRATAYGNDFPLVATNPQTGKEYTISVGLDQFKYNDFDLKGDENGWFDYVVGNTVFKYKYPTKADEIKLRDTIVGQISDFSRSNIYKNLLEVQNSLSRVNFSEEEMKNFTEDLEEMKEITGNVKDEDEMGYPKAVTEQMTMNTMAINGRTDREYIKGYIENMRVGDAKKYRDYMTKNKPGVDMTVNVDIPESDGGGSFATFLRLDDTIFITY